MPSALFLSVECFFLELVNPLALSRQFFLLQYIPLCLQNNEQRLRSQHYQFHLSAIFLRLGYTKQIGSNFFSLVTILHNQITSISGQFIILYRLNSEPSLRICLISLNRLYSSAINFLICNIFYLSKYI